MDGFAANPPLRLHSFRSHAAQAKNTGPQEAKNKTSHSLPKRIGIVSHQSHTSVSTSCTPRVLEQSLRLIQNRPLSRKPPRPPRIHVLVVTPIPSPKVHVQHFAYFSPPAKTNIATPTKGIPPPSPHYVSSTSHLWNQLRTLPSSHKIANNVIWSMSRLCKRRSCPKLTLAALIHLIYCSITPYYMALGPVQPYGVRYQWWGH